MVGGKVKLFLIKFDCKKNEKEWKRRNVLDMNSLYQMFKDTLPQSHPNLLQAEYDYFCSVRDFLRPKLKYHPFLLTYEEREEIVIRAHRKMKRRIRTLTINVENWTSRIQHANQPSICTAVFYYPSIQRQKKAAELKTQLGLIFEPVVYYPKDYTNDFWSYVDYLRNFSAHIEDADTLDNYRQIIQDFYKNSPKKEIT